MNKLVIYTQIMENYGAHDWNGKGTCPDYWKPKGGNEYIIKGVWWDNDYEWADVRTEQLLIEARREIEHSNEYFVEYYIGCNIVPEDNKVDGEKPPKRKKQPAPELLLWDIRD